MKKQFRRITLVVGALLAGNSLAQDITAFKDGYLTFTNTNPALYYRVEFRPNLNGPEAWDGSYNGLKNIHTTNTSVTVPVGVFYRAVGSTNAMSEGKATVPRTGQAEVYRTGDDGDQAKGAAWPVPRFTDNGDGTVNDNLTGLMWARNANIFTNQCNWNTAIDLCNNLNLATHADWRLPNIRELESLLDYARMNPPLPEGHSFTNVLSDYYWTSTTAAESAFYAWCVHLRDGTAGGQDKALSYCVWPVRAGP